MSAYKPTKVDIAWTQNLLKMTSEGAVWGWPTAGLIYKISHKNKTLTLLNPELLADELAASSHKLTIAVFEQVGYSIKVLDKQD